ncbi:MAG: hypothetical protein AB1349_04685 [Elusimicrobiota bacterium]
MKTKILMIGKNDKNAEKKEIEFELDYLMSLTTGQRFKMMHDRSLLIMKRIKKYEHRTTPEITQRT